MAWDTVVAHMDEEGIPHLMRDVASPAGDFSSAKIRERRAAGDAGADSAE